MGNILQIDAELKNLIVRNEVYDCPLKIGDSILKIENKKINTFEDFNYILSTLDKSKDIFKETVSRLNESMIQFFV